MASGVKTSVSLGGTAAQGSERKRTDWHGIDLPDTSPPTLQYLPTTQARRLRPSRDIRPIPLLIERDKLVWAFSAHTALDGEGWTVGRVRGEGEEVEEEGVEGSGEDVVKPRRDRVGEERRSRRYGLRERQVSLRLGAVAGRVYLRRLRPFLSRRKRRAEVTSVGLMKWGGGKRGRWEELDSSLVGQAEF